MNNEFGPSELREMGKVWKYYFLLLSKTQYCEIAMSEKVGD